VSVNVAARTIAGNYGSTAATNDLTLLIDNFLADSGSSWTATFSGLSNGTCDVYYYAPRHPSVSTGPFAINGTAVTSLPGNLTFLAQGLSYDLLTSVSVTGGTMTFQSTGSSGYRGLSGVQIIEQYAPNVIPEPSTFVIWSLLGFAGIAVGWRRRRRSA